MKISKTGAALALAGIVCGASAASAQLDMSGAADVLAGIRAQKAATGPQAPAKKPGAPAAKAIAPSADAQSWQKILDAVKKSGKYTAEKPPFTPGEFSLEDIGGDKNADHAEDRVSVFGMMNEDELFEVGGAGLISDQWKKGADGNWSVDRWLFQTDIYGTVQDVAHVTLVMSPDLKPSGLNEEALKPADPRIGQKYQAIIAHWAAPRP